MGGEEGGGGELKCSSREGGGGNRIWSIFFLDWLVCTQVEEDEEEEGDVKYRSFLMVRRRVGLKLLVQLQF